MIINIQGEKSLLQSYVLEVTSKTDVNIIMISSALEFVWKKNLLLIFVNLIILFNFCFCFSYDFLL